jgi:hypothetical protein
MLTLTEEQADHVIELLRNGIDRKLRELERDRALLATLEAGRAPRPPIDPIPPLSKPPMPAPPASAASPARKIQAHRRGRPLGSPNKKSRKNSQTGTSDSLGFDPADRPSLGCAGSARRSLTHIDKLLYAIIGMSPYGKF